MAIEIQDIDLAVRELTQKHTSKVMQTSTAGITCVSEVRHDPLLMRLRDAVAGGISSHGSATQGRERIPLDPGALQLFDKIAEAVNAWYLELPAHQRRHLRIDDRLAAWYVTARDRLGDEDDVLAQAEARLLMNWQRRIEAMFDPPRTLELTSEVRACLLVRRSRRRWDAELGRMVSKPRMVAKKDGDGHPVEHVVTHVPDPCPVCGEQYALQPRTGDQVIALAIEYRDLGEETLDHAVARCRFCEHVWRGRTAIRELRWLIDHADERIDTPERSDALVSA